MIWDWKPAPDQDVASTLVETDIGGDDGLESYANTLLILRTGKIVERLDHATLGSLALKCADARSSQFNCGDSRSRDQRVGGRYCQL